MDKVAADTIHTAARQAGKVMAEVLNDTLAAINPVVAAVLPGILELVRWAGAFQEPANESRNRTGRKG
jgi:hypothetical protein